MANLAISVRRWVALQAVLGRAGKNPVSASAARPCGVVALVGARFEPAPKMSEITTVETFLGKQAVVVRNTSWVNFFDLCAISLPLPREGGLPVGLMLVARNGHDRRLFQIAAAVERLFAA
jgi:Asp-tRNA(Asn)/Glu-tRNA(Gln) amidotransferase A subunit family amidase